MRLKTTLVLLIALTLGVAVFSLFWNTIASMSPKPVPAVAAPTNVRHLEAPEISFIDQILGPKDAEVTIVEYGDYLCPHCRTSELAIRQLMEEQPKRIRFVWKDMPSQLHPSAESAAEAGLCAAKQGAFWEFHRILIDIGGSYDETSMAFQADQAGLDTQAFVTCLTTNETQPLVERTIDEGLALGIDGLPTFYINGKRYEGALTYEELLEAVL